MNQSKVRKFWIDPKPSDLRLCNAFVKGSLPWGSKTYYVIESAPILSELKAVGEMAFDIKHECGMLPDKAARGFAIDVATEILDRLDKLIAEMEE